MKIHQHIVRLLTTLLAAHTLLAEAVEVRFKRVADGVFAHVGDTGPRSLANEGLNANLGLVVTPGGAVLIDSGATFRGAHDIHAAIRKVTDQPVRWVINTGTQDHRWFGNGYFEALGAELIAHESAVADMSSRSGDQLQVLKSILGPAVENTVPVLPKRLLKGTDARFELAGVVFEFRARGGGHTPGDMMVWLPQSEVVFAGDIVYVDRLLAVLPVSSTRAWLDAFAALEQLLPLRIVPGHGRVTNLATARVQTRAYLEALRHHMKRAFDAGVDISDAVKSFDVSPFLHLSNAAELNPGNANRTYLEIERE